MTGSERLEILEEGKDPKLILRMKSGFAVMGDTQVLRGYCLLLAYPEANHLTDLARAARAQYLCDLGLLGEAVLAVTNCSRINYAILGNLDPFLHAHVWPRYAWELEELRTLSPTHYPSDIINASENAYDPRAHEPLRLQIASRLTALMGNDPEP